VGSAAQQVGSAAQQLGSGAQHEGSQQPRWRWKASAWLAVSTNRPANNSAGNTRRDFMDGTPKQKLGGFNFSSAATAKCLWRIVLRKSGKAVPRLVDAFPLGKASLLVIVDAVLVS
jgi:hypothetical protein